MYFSFIPPEIISGNIYTGPGSGPLLAAATAWERLSGELQSAAGEYNAVVAGLTAESWAGPSAASMAAAAGPYAAWMSVTAEQAAEAAAQAQAAAAAYETVFAAVVPPQVVSANRTQLMALMATNVVGQNTAAIAATEAQYLEMWAQDAAAMHAYASSSAAATKVRSFTEPPATTNGAAAPAAASAAGNPILQFGADMANQYTSFFNNLLNTMAGTPDAGSTFSALYSAAKVPLGMTTQFNASSLAAQFPIQNFLKFAPPLGRVPTEIPATGLGAGLAMNSSLPGGLGSTVSAGMGEANLVGSLAAPPAWAGQSPAIRVAVNAVPNAGAVGAPAAIQGNVLGQMALGGMTGGAVGSSVPRVAGAAAGRTRVTTGMGATTPARIDKVLARLRHQPETVQHWNTDQAGLDSLLDELSRKPGIHAVHLKGAKKATTTPAP
ncbi:PPE family protein [[Mycobacterium] nativiensis]|uniref:PPE family protein n=1 Tax=[Mycobacterium] nativiensis TaxID=2855503 RepID=A0ABU5XTD8_9MYCO|nr:PPE family protein [Mycolicibacter sp. MYC340]MEB3031246.1 PPE family protein [Mycolicibacter sp. MYC340]